MDNFYEIATIVLGCVVIAQYFRLKKHNRTAQHMMHTINQISRKAWVIRETSEGFEVLDEDGDRVVRIVDREKV